MSDELGKRLSAARKWDVEDAARKAGTTLVENAAAGGLVDVAYAWVDSPLGRLLAARTTKGLARISYVGENEDLILTDLADRISPRVLEAPARLDDLRRELDEYFHGRRQGFDVPIDWGLTSGFGRRVLKATARIPFGRISSYKQIAAAAGSPRGSRAAGNALGANPIPIVVPCHRVLATGGKIGGYTGGLEKKEWLLTLEGYLEPAGE
ncbi:MAG TPA: methylated-DNA--[protein]-cysteine S-methyltransferase [Actinomycetota bacterium]|jgi:methylated-DNA-[protein]-cysteine S-methyltransferase